MWLSRATSYIWLYCARYPRKSYGKTSWKRFALMMQSTAIKGIERGNARPTSSFDRNSQVHGRSISAFAKDPCRPTKSRNARTSHDPPDRTAVSRSTQNGRCRQNFPRTNDRVYESERHARPRIILPLAHMGPPVSGPPVSSPSPSYTPPPPFITISGRSPLLITVDEQPCVSSYFLSADDRPRPPGSQWSQTRFDARNRPEPIAKQSPRVGRLTEFQLAKNWKLGMVIPVRIDKKCRYSL